jgi:hypothetical protein
MYKQHSTFENIVIKTDEDKYIPKEEGNKDYQAYLRWCEEGNEPEPADTPE